MMNGIGALWENYISQMDYQIRPDSKYRKISLEADPFLDKVWSELSKEGKQAFDDYYYKQSQLNSITEGDCFIRGFRMGAHIILDLMGEYQSDFMPIGGEEE